MKDAFKAPPITNPDWLMKGEAAATSQGMRHNEKVMERAGYSKKRAEGTAYGEVGMEKMARRHESMGMKRAMHKK